MAIDSTLIIVAVISATPPTIMAFLTWQQTRKIHISVNSKMDALLEATKGESFAQGREVGRDEKK